MNWFQYLKHMDLKLIIKDEHPDHVSGSSVGTLFSPVISRIRRRLYQKVLFVMHIVF